MIRRHASHSVRSFTPVAASHTAMCPLHAPVPEVSLEPHAFFLCGRTRCREPNAWSPFNPATISIKFSCISFWQPYLVWWGWEWEWEWEWEWWSWWVRE